MSSYRFRPNYNGARRKYRYENEQLEPWEKVGLAKDVEDGLLQCTGDDGVLQHLPGGSGWHFMHLSDLGT